MPNKKITVVGDGAEEPLTPDEEHDIEVRVDRMLDPTLPDGTTAKRPIETPEPDVFAEAEPDSQPEPKPEPTPEPKKVTKIVTKFADEDEDEEAATPVAAPDPPKPVVKKIAIKHHDEEEPEAAEAKPEAKPTKSSAKSTSKKAAPKPHKPAAKPDNLESKADAITAAALAAAEQMQPASADVTDEPREPETAPGSAEELPAEPSEPAEVDTTPGAPPVIRGHAAAPLNAESELVDEVSTTVPKKAKTIAITDNSGTEPEVVEVEEVEAPTSEAVAKEAEAEPTVDADDTPEEPTSTDDETEPAEDQQPVVEDEPEPTPEPVEVAEDSEPADAEPAEDSDGKKYRPPEGPIQFKRAEVPIDPYKPGTGPRSPAETDSLANEDAALTEAFETKPAAKPKRAASLSVGKTFKRLVTLVVIVLVLAVIAAVALPSVRNEALGAVGMTGDVRVSVLDATTKTPLSDATVSSGKSSATTDSSGSATLHGVKLGSRQLQIQKYAFASKSQALTVAWHSQNTTSASLAATGQHYALTVVDYVSGQPIPGAKLSSDKASATTDAKGQATLVAPTSSSLAVTASATEYSQQQTSVASSNGSITLTPSGLDVYISRSGGKFNVYKNTVDGHNEQLVLANAGSSASDLAIAPNTAGDTAALVSTRDNTHDSSGNLQDSLTLITTNSGATKVVDHADTIKLVDWFGSRIVYVLSKTSTSTTDPDRYQLVSYDTAQAKRVVLDHAAYLNDVLRAEGTIYYATATNGSTSGQFVSIHADGTAKHIILTTEIAAIDRTNYNTLTLSSINKWYTFHLGGTKATSTTAPNTTAESLYVDSPYGEMGVRVDTSKSTPQLVLYKTATGKESVLTEAAGITSPVHWLNANTIIYRVSSGGVVTDKVVTVSGGTSKTIASVSDIAGISLWHD